MPFQFGSAIAHTLDELSSIPAQTGKVLTPPTGDAILVSVKAAAVRIGLSPREVYRMLNDGTLPFVARGSRKLVDLKHLQAWAAR